MRFALLSVSYSGLFYAGRALALEEQIDKAQALGFDALAIEAKRPVACPLDLSQADRERIKAVAADRGIELCAIESVSNFTSRFMEERENNLAMMREVLRLASDLDVGLVKVFAAWPGVIDDEEAIAMYGPYDRGHHYRRLYPPDLRRWRRAVHGIREVAAWAADLGVTLVLQNHAPVIAPGYEDALAMMQEIDRPNVKLCLDVNLFHDRQSDQYVQEAVDRCGPYLAFTHYGAWNFSEAPDGGDGGVVQDPAPSFGGLINYPAFIAALQRIGYSGYLTSEYCTPVVDRHEYAGIEAVDAGTRLALRYMKRLVHESSARPAGNTPWKSVAASSS